MESNKKISVIELTLFEYLKISLTNDDDQTKQISTPVFSNEQWKQFFAIAKQHEVLSLIGNELEKQKLPEELRELLVRCEARTVQTGLRLQMLDAKLTELLKQEKIIAITLKGNSISLYYPTPELRKTTDIDLLIPNEANVEKAEKLLCRNGFSYAKEQHALHHQVLLSPDGQTVEVHRMLANPFQKQSLNRYLEMIKEQSLEHCHEVSYQGICWYAYDLPWQAYYLLIHMLQHFLTSGFGLRNLCDWVVIWNQCTEKEARRQFWNMACESKID